MSHTTLTRLSGLALMAAFAFALAGGILHPVIGDDSHAASSLVQPLFPAAHLLVFLGEICLLFGLPGLYARIAPKTGILGFSGFVLYFFANATLASFVTAYEAFIVPVLAADPATSDLVAPDGAISSSAPFALLQGVGGMVYAGTRAVGHRRLPLPGATEVDRSIDGRVSDPAVVTDTGGTCLHRLADRAAARARRGGHGIRALRQSGRGAYEHSGSPANVVEEGESTFAIVIGISRNLAI
jgi:hypothetical protein